MSPRVLVVDDDRAVRSVLQIHLTRHGLQTTLANNPAEALETLREAPFDLIISDMLMPGGTGLELLEKVRGTWPDIQVVIMTGYGSVPDAVKAMKLGAADYLIKPVSRDELLVVVDRALERRSMAQELVALRAEVQDRYGFENLIGAHPKMIDLYEQVAAVADSSATVLIEGETGTGKELIAAAIHHRSRRRNGAFVRVHCAAIPQSLLESELFGHEKGAFTGAIRQHQGKFEQADGGTILLDEIGEIDPYTQVKLLRVLQEGEIQRVGGTETLRVDVRVLAATNKDLKEEVRAGRFRKDLFFRLHVVCLTIPALNKRRSDIPVLVDHFLNEFAVRNDRATPVITDEVLETLVRASWPGNVRQLQHVIERAVVLCRGDTIDSIELPEDFDLKESTSASSVLLPEGQSLQQALLEHEREILLATIKEENGVQARAAKKLGISRSNLSYRLKRLDVNTKDL